MEQRLEERRREEANLTDSQKQQLFEAPTVGAWHV